jgi:hypothetical protein
MFPRLLSVTAVAAIFCLVGCSSTEADAATQQTEEPAESKPMTVTDEKGQELAVFIDSNGDVNCPLMNLPTPIERALGHVDVDGVRYYMCCTSCIGMADKNPEGVADKAKSLNPAFFTALDVTEEAAS